jgi:hypothetical protein
MEAVKARSNWAVGSLLITTLAAGLVFGLSWVVP